MAAKKGPTPAIDLDHALDQSLNELSAADLLKVLAHKDVVNTTTAQVLPDKKKYELWVEPEDGIFDVSLRDVLERLKTEKKKAEIERPPGGRFDETIGREGQLQYERLVEDVAARVEERLRQR